MHMLRNNFVRIGIGTALLLLMPLIAMQFDNGVQWTGSDFAVAGVLLLAAGFSFELLSRKFGNRAYVGIAVLAVLAYVWAELAVGIFTNLGS